MYCWKNLDTGTRVVSNDGRVVIVEGWCIDLQENNYYHSQVARSILTAKGERFSDSLQATTISAAGAMAFRNSIFKIIPRIFIDKILEKCVKKVQDDEKLLEKRDNVIKHLEKLGVQLSDILSYFRKESVGDLTSTNIVDMMGIGTSIREGAVKAQEAFKFNEITGEVVSSDHQDIHTSTSTDVLLKHAESLRKEV